jgi:hypothetical protein
MHAPRHIRVSALNTRYYRSQVLPRRAESLRRFAFDSVALKRATLHSRSAEYSSRLASALHNAPLDDLTAAYLEKAE